MYAKLNTKSKSMFLFLDKESESRVRDKISNNKRISAMDRSNKLAVRKKKKQEQVYLFSPKHTSVKKNYIKTFLCFKHIRDQYDSSDGFSVFFFLEDRLHVGRTTREQTGKLLKYNLPKYYEDLQWIPRLKRLEPPVLLDPTNAIELHTTIDRGAKTLIRSLPERHFQDFFRSQINQRKFQRLHTQHTKRKCTRETHRRKAGKNTKRRNMIKSSSN
ncbi:hypothetical protein BY458DRAFT_492409 [Sporodiniella umbellata]|nr:hypothetical protein BY458DRAFT_492409 [Sporodiniella umbellata]